MADDCQFYGTNLAACRSLALHARGKGEREREREMKSRDKMMLH